MPRTLSSVRCAWKRREETTTKGKDSLRSWDPLAPSLPISSLKILGTCTREGSLHLFVKFQSHIPPKSFRRLLAFGPHYGVGGSGNLKRDNGPGRSTSTPLKFASQRFFRKRGPSSHNLQLHSIGEGFQPQAPPALSIMKNLTRAPPAGGPSPSIRSTYKPGAPCTPPEHAVYQGSFSKPMDESLIRRPTAIIYLATARRE